MTTIDIRTVTAPVTSIIVANPDPDFYIADSLKARDNGGFEIQDRQAGRSLRVRDREHAENLIKGLQKAVELGWV